MSYLVDNKLVSNIRVVDKVPPPMAWLNEEHKAIFENPIVEFKSSNLLNPGMLLKNLDLLSIKSNIINVFILNIKVPEKLPFLLMMGHQNGIMSLI